MSKDSDVVAGDWQLRLPIVAQGRYAPRDLRKLQWLISSHVRTLWRGYGLGASFCALMFGYMLVTADEPAERKSVLFTTGLLVSAVTLVVIVMFVLPRRKERADWKASKPPYDERTLTFTDDGLTCETSQANSAIKWTAFVGLEETPEFFVLVLQKDAECVLVPKSFVRSRDDWSALVAMAKAKVAQRD